MGTTVMSQMGAGLRDPTIEHWKTLGLKHIASKLQWWIGVILLIVIALVFSLVIPMHRESEVVVSEIAGMNLSGDKITILRPRGSISGHLRQTNMHVSARVFACVDGVCDFASAVNLDGTWSVPDVTFRHPAENAQEAQLQVIAAYMKRPDGAPEYFYSKTITVSFPPPEVTVDGVCNQSATAPPNRLPICTPLTLQGRARNLFWKLERICVQVQNGDGTLITGPAVFQGTNPETWIWSSNQTNPLREEAMVATVGLDSMPTGACNLQSVLIEKRAFNLSRMSGMR